MAEASVFDVLYRQHRPIVCCNAAYRINGPVKPISSHPVHQWKQVHDPNQGTWHELQGIDFHNDTSGGGTVPALADCTMACAAT
jgi:hypothetical protein